MKTILIQTKNDRGGEQRVSTNKDTLEITVFFKGENKEIMKELLILKRTSGGSLRVENENGLLWQTEGNEGEKLQIK